MATVDVKIGELSAIVADNEGYADHQPGLNGIASLTSVHYQKELVAPTTALLNFEHIARGVRLHDDTERFEPRHSPMAITKTHEDVAVLQQSPTHWTGLESRTTFAFKEPYYIDVTFECRPTREAFPFGYMCLFWASYINNPENKSTYFYGNSPGSGDHWRQFLTQYHFRDATVAAKGENPELPRDPSSQMGLYYSYSDLRFDLPFFYGLYGPMVFSLFFEDASGLRFAHSPSGGGMVTEGKDTNPAWDFQYLIQNPQENETYRRTARVVYKPYAGRADLLSEYERFVHR